MSPRVNVHNVNFVKGLDLIGLCRFLAWLTQVKISYKNSIYLYFRLFRLWPMKSPGFLHR